MFEIKIIRTILNKEKMLQYMGSDLQIYSNQRILNAMNTQCSASYLPSLQIFPVC